MDIKIPIIIMSTYHTYPDEQLLRLLKDSNDAAFTEVYNRYHKRVYGYLLTLVKIPSTAEDLVHEIFMRLWEIRESLEINSSLEAYLVRAGHNKAVDMTRRIAKEKSLKAELLRHYELIVTDAPRSIEEYYKYDALVEEALGRLSPQRRKVFEMCRKQGKSYREVAEELHITPNTVKEHMAKSLSLLRAFLQEKGEIALLIILLGKFF